MSWTGDWYSNRDTIIFKDCEKFLWVKVVHLEFKRKEEDRNVPSL